MCGIFGLIGKKKDNIKNKDVVKQLFKLSETRGKEASGYAILLNNKIIVNKSPLQASKLIKTKNFIDDINNFDKYDQYLIIGHSRLVTNGDENNDLNNQPFVKNNIIGIHNGIIVNIHKLWDYYGNNKRISDLDSEIISEIIKTDDKDTLKSSLEGLYNQIEGTANLALFFNNFNNLILTSNNGSLYYASNDDFLIFASESIIIDKILKKGNIKIDINHIEPNNFKSINYLNLSIEDFSLKHKSSIENLSDRQASTIDFNFEKDIKKSINKSVQTVNLNLKSEFSKYFEQSTTKIEKIKRCNKCLLPETFPFIEFDENGVCSVCNNYKKIEYLGYNKLVEDVNDLIKIDKNKINTLVAFSGGRDSSYSLHLAKKELGLNPIAFSYDWGMITDLARRNQSRLCSKLGIEHILISADIKKKRENIRKNVEAWLRMPHLGTIPLFMAGDKQYFYYANKLIKDYSLNLITMGENYLEKTGFKVEFSGARQKKSGFMSYHIDLFSKLSMLKFYGLQYLSNPAYINSSLIDTFGAFISYYGLKKDYLNVFDYIEWDEKQINKIIIDEYDWELEEGYKSTWRIGDGTAPFYNYIYYMVAGFTENDTFRSNQIREGHLNRDDALKLVEDENQARWKSIKWYCDTIDIDFDRTINIINKIPKLYS